MSLIKDMPKLVCVVVTYNRADKLRVCLSNTLRQNVDYIVVIDNGSTDQTDLILRNIRTCDGRLISERQRVNRGGSWGFARGMRIADRLIGGEGWLILFDDDSWPACGCINEFRKRVFNYQHEGIAMVASAVLDMKGVAVEANRPILNIFRRPLYTLKRTLPTARSLRDAYHLPHKSIVSESQYIGVDAISFVGLFIDLARLPSARGRYPRGALFIYSDDTLYTLTLTSDLYGCRAVMDPNLVFYHDTKAGGASVSFLRPTWKYYYIVRNSFLVNRAISKTCYYPLCLITVITYLTKAFVWMLCTKDLSAARMVFLGLVDGITNKYSRQHQEILRLLYQSDLG